MNKQDLIYYEPGTGITDPLGILCNKAQAMHIKSASLFPIFGKSPWREFKDSFCTVTGLGRCLLHTNDVMKEKRSPDYYFKQFKYEAFIYYSTITSLYIQKDLKLKYSKNKSDPIFCRREKALKALKCALDYADSHGSGSGYDCICQAVSKFSEQDTILTTAVRAAYLMQYFRIVHYRTDTPTALDFMYDTTEDPELSCYLKQQIDYIKNLDKYIGIYDNLGSERIEENESVIEKGETNMKTKTNSINKYFYAISKSAAALDFDGNLLLLEPAGELYHRYDPDAKKIVTMSRDCVIELDTEISYVIPVKPEEIKENDIIAQEKHNGLFKHVIKPYDGEVITVVDLVSGSMERIVPNTLLGQMPIVLKVCRLFNGKIGNDGMSPMVLMALMGNSDEDSEDSTIDPMMLMMMSNNSGDCNNLLPLMLMKDDSLSDDKLLLMMLMQNKNENNINLLLPLLLNKGKGNKTMLLAMSMMNQNK